MKNIAEARERLRERHTVTFGFSFSGQVVSSDAAPNFIVKDHTGFQEIKLGHLRDSNVKCADLVQIEGTVRKYPSGLTEFFAQKMRVISGGVRPKPEDGLHHQMTDPDYNYRYVRFKGVPYRAVADDFDDSYNWLLLRIESGVVKIAVGVGVCGISELSKLIGAEISVQGFIIPFKNIRRNLGSYLSLTDSKDITVIRPAAADPFDIPSGAYRTRLNRERHDGPVTAVSARKFFITSRDESCIAVSLGENIKPPKIGQWVSAVGFRTISSAYPEITDAIYRTIPKTAGIAPAAKVDISDIFTKSDDGRKVIDYRLNRNPVALTGKILSNPQTLEESRTFSIVTGGYTVNVDISGLPEKTAASVKNNSIAEISGLCIFEFDHGGSTSPFPLFKRLTLYPRTPDEVRILAAPPWWTPAKFTVLTGILIAVIAAMLVWNRTLQRLSDIKSSRISHEKFARMAAQLKAEERRRLSVELHDSIAQNLTGIAMTVNTVRDIHKSGGAVPLQLLDVAVSALKSCREDIRNCLWELRNDALEAPTMDEAIRRTLAPHTRGIETHIRFNVPRSLFSDNSAHSVLYMIRELAINAVRHGRAKKLRIAGASENGKLLFSVRDDGCGFDCAACSGTEDGHFGLQGVRERAASLEGIVTIASARGKGTKVTATVFIPETQT